MWHKYDAIRKHLSVKY